MTRISAANFAQEPFRIFFPLGVLAGIIGVALWPLVLTGVMETYPGTMHARIMTWGFLGGFIFGFLGTAMPRMLSATHLSVPETTLLVLIHVSMVTAFSLGHVFGGDLLFLVLLMAFLACMAPRFKNRTDNPPPGFILVALALLCAGGGAILALLQARLDLEPFWVVLQKLLAYQGFILLPILGIGPFILPRFFGMESAHDFPESRRPTRAWSRKAISSSAAGLLILASFVLEAKGSLRVAHALRFITTLSYLATEMPFRKGPRSGNVLGLSIRIALAGILLGYLCIAFLPAYRVGLLHLTLIGGFSIITLTVATRVVFGHSGNLDRLKDRNRWMLVTAGLILFGMVTRITGDFLPRILISHYIYGALIWIAGILLWSIYVLPKVLVVEDESRSGAA